MSFIVFSITKHCKYLQSVASIFHQITVHTGALAWLDAPPAHSQSNGQIHRNICVVLEPKFVACMLMAHNTL